MTTRALTARKVALSTVAVLALISATSCAAPPLEEMQLVETKANVQLLRNSAAERLPSDAFSSAVNGMDRSEECNSGDPWRLWKSSVTLNLNPSTPARDLYEQLVSSYEDDGWESASVNRTSTLSREESVAKIDLILNEDHPLNPTLDVVVSGACVLTDGADSDEVKNLETTN